MITLLNGQQVDGSKISFDANTYHFFLGQSDLTNQIRRADKLALIPWFDADTENLRIQAERYSMENGGESQRPLGSQSLFGNLTDQLLHDPLGAPLDTLNATVNKIFTAPGVLKVLFIVALVGGAYWFFKLRKKG